MRRPAPARRGQSARGWPPATTSASGVRAPEASRRFALGKRRSWRPSEESTSSAERPGSAYEATRFRARSGYHAAAAGPRQIRRLGARRAALLNTPSSPPTLANASSARSRCAARAPRRSARGSAPVPSARPGTRSRSRRCPRSSSRRAISCASRASQSMIGTIGWTPGRISKPARGHRRRGSTACSPRAGRGARWSREQLEHAMRGAHHRGRQRVGEEVGPRALAQELDDLLAPAGEAADRAAERLAERRGDDVDAPQDAAMLGVPRPVAPTNPVAWQSSTITSAP